MQGRHPFNLLDKEWLRQDHWGGFKIIEALSSEIFKIISIFFINPEIKVNEYPNGY